MAPERGENARLSDTEGGEKPVREKLQKAHITHDTSTPASDAMAGDDFGEDAAKGSEGLKVQAQPRGQLQKKRSYEEIDGENVKSTTSEPAKHHTRKRSRDSTADEDQLNNGRRKVSGERPRNGDNSAEDEMDHEAEVEPDIVSKTPQTTTPEPATESRIEATIEDMSSPKTKRSRLLSDTPATVTDKSKSNGVQIPAKPETTTKIPATSGFANASATSPFGALAKSKSPEPQTSASAFAASGFSALSGSSTSGFGAVAKSSSGFGSGGTFATGAKSSLSAKENEAPKASGFGGVLGQSSGLSGAASSTSAFGSGASGFGKIGSPSGGFGSALGGAGFGSLSGGGLSSFASGGKAPAPLGGASKATKSFGAPAAEDDDDEENDGDDDDKTGMKSPLTAEEDKQDERFYEQSLETGEEDETTDFSSRAKLYNFTANADGKKEWRERGLGILRLNVKKISSDEDEKAKARLLMRADGSHRVVLNTPVLKDMKFGTATGGPPQGGYMLFMGTIEGSSGLELLQVKMRQQNCMDLYERVSELQENM